jgi:hypothetical protein
MENNIVDNMTIIIPIILGNNNDTLFGTENDVLLMYNLFYKFHKLTLNVRWLKPSILINEELKIKNINKIIIQMTDMIAHNIFKNSNVNFIIIIYFSGHSNSKGNLKFYDEYVNAHTLLINVNKLLHLSSPFRVYFIIDSCFSTSFISANNINNSINKLSFLVSCKENEYSKEIEAEFDDNMFKYKYINTKPKSHIIVSIFTLYFVKLIEARGIEDIDKFKNIITDRLWLMISKKYRQTIYYKEL